MSSFEEDSYSMIFTSLKHPIRRKILRTLSNEAQSFSDLQKQFKIESSHLTYHIDGLGSLLNKTEDEKYALSSLGQAAVLTMQNVEEPPSTLYFHLKQASRLNGKKIAGRTMAIAFGIMCIVLVATLVGAFAYYIPLLNDKDQTISFLNTQIAEKDYQIYLQNLTIHNFQGQLNDLYSMLVLNKSTVVYSSFELVPPHETVLPANFTSGFTLGMIGLDGDPHFGTYSGIALVQVSSNYDTYVTTTFTSHGYDFNSQAYVGMNGTAAFVIAPPDNSDSGINITVNTQEHVIGATANITITYIY
jgi:DNA-binding transcriptional ArsR family regulator